MIVYILLQCLTPKHIPVEVNDCRVVSVHRQPDSAYRVAWDRCALDHECVTHYYVQQAGIEP
jgi:hypothetical protein